MKQTKITYIGGGSKDWFWTLMGDLALQEGLEGVVTLYDINVEAAEANARLANKLSAAPGSRSHWEYRVCPTLAQALAGTEYVVISILPGPLSLMESDIHAPERYGIWQTVGDTTGPGGLVRALRCIPTFMEFGQAIGKYAPEAWVINYTNPMTLCTAALYAGFPGIKAMGCCHEVFGVQRLLAYAAERYAGTGHVSRDEINTTVIGVNHFTWITHADWKGLDLKPAYCQLVEEYGKSGLVGVEKDSPPESVFASLNLVKFDLFRRYGVIAAAGDRHLSEFVPPLYLHDPASAARWGFKLTDYAFRKEMYAQRAMRREALLSGAEEYVFKPSGEEGVRIIRGLAGLESFVTNVNIPNVGQFSTLPMGAVVECNALVHDNRLEPIFVGDLPKQVDALIARVVYNQRDILRASIQRDEQMAFNAFVNDPLVTCSRDDALQLFREMQQATAAYLPAWKTTAID